MCEIALPIKTEVKMIIVTNAECKKLFSLVNKLSLVVCTFMIALLDQFFFL